MVPWNLSVIYYPATPPSSLSGPCVVLGGGKGFSSNKCTPKPVCLSSSYDHEGRLTNVTRPTGVVTSLHREMEKSITIDIENSNRDDDVTVITNLSSVEASYTVVQGELPSH